MKEPIEGFTAPALPPQLEVEANGSLEDLIFGSPSWNENSKGFASELAFLVRKHIVVRSAIGFALELAKVEEQKLRNQRDPIDLYKAQGGADALDRFASTLLMQMQDADKPKETPQ